MSFTAVAPLFLGVLILLSLTFLALSEKSKMAHECRVLLLTAQNEKAILLEKLLKMNKKAQALRTQMKNAKRRLFAAKATGYGPAIAAAKAHVFYIRAKQTLFRGKQLFILGQVKAIDFKARMSWHKNVLKSAKYSLRKQYISTSDLAIYSTPPLSLSPSYKTKAQFKKLQTTYAGVTINFYSGLPKWLQKPFTRNFYLKISCAATIEQWRGKWTPILTIAKP